MVKTMTHSSNNQPANESADQSIHPSNTNHTTDHHHSTDQHTTNATRTIALTPGELIANIPGALGFFPQDSMVFMGFCEKNGHLTLGPTVRIDIAHAEETLPEAYDALRLSRIEVAFAFIISARPEQFLEQVMDVAIAQAADNGIELVACWYCPEISFGQFFEIWYGPDFDEESNYGEEWMRGTIPSIAAATSTQTLLDAGRLPEVDRKDAFAPLQAHNHSFCPKHSMMLEAGAYYFGQRFAASRPGDAPRDNDGCYLPELMELIPQRFAELDDSLVLADVLRDTSLLHFTGLLMSNARMRDLSLLDFLDNPTKSETLLLAAIQTFKGLIRANALTVYSAVLLSQRLGSLASAPLKIALEEFPDHSLANLLFEAYNRGLLEWSVDTLRHGSELARKELAEFDSPTPHTGFRPASSPDADPEADTEADTESKVDTERDSESEREVTIMSEDDQAAARQRIQALFNPAGTTFAAQAGEKWTKLCELIAKHPVFYDDDDDYDEDYDEDDEWNWWDDEDEDDYDEEDYDVDAA